MGRLDAVILAGSSAVRSPQTPTAVLTLAGEPLVARAAARAAALAPASVLVVADRSAVPALEAWAAGKATVLGQDPGGGSARATTRALAALGSDAETLLVVYGDRPRLSERSLRRLVEALGTDAAASVLTVERSKPEGHARVVRDLTGGVVRAVTDCSLAPGEESIQEVIAGAYCFCAAALRRAVSQAPQAGFLGELLAPLAASGRRVVAVPLDGPSEAEGVYSEVQARAFERELLGQAA